MLALHKLLRVFKMDAICLLSFGSPSMASGLNFSFFSTGGYFPLCFVSQQYSTSQEVTDFFGNIRLSYSVFPTSSSHLELSHQPAATFTPQAAPSPVHLAGFYVPYSYLRTAEQHNLLEPLTFALMLLWRSCPKAHLPAVKNTLL